MKNTFKCECGAYFKNPLKADNPFEDGEFIYACPHCLSVDSFNGVCEVGDCKQVATCGTPTKGLDGWDVDYVRCCGEHYSELQK